MLPSCARDLTTYQERFALPRFQRPAQIRLWSPYGLRRADRQAVPMAFTRADLTHLRHHAKPVTDAFKSAIPDRTSVLH